jgi:hypothetical protein
MTLGEAHPAVPSDRSPNSVSLDTAHDIPPQHCLSHTVCHLCYDRVAHAHGVPTKGRKEHRWTLSRLWMR